MFIVRLGTQILSRSKYEHIANVIKCPEYYDGYEYIDNRGKIIVKAGELYVFEATYYKDFIMNKLDHRLANPSHNEDSWSGTFYFKNLQIKISI